MVNKVGDEFQVNTYTQNDQSWPQVAIAENGNFVVVWGSWQQDGGQDGVFAQVFNASGTPMGGEIQVNQTTERSQEYADVAMDAQGNFTVVWQSRDDSNDGVFARRFDSTGNPLGNEFLVHEDTMHGQKEPHIAMNGNGDFVVAWEISYLGGRGFPSHPDVFARFFNASGNPMGNEFMVNTFTDHTQHDIAAAINNQGNIIFTWASHKQEDTDSTSYGIFARQYTLGGGAVGNEFQVNMTTMNAQIAPDVEMNRDGQFVIVWESNQQAAPKGIMTRHYSGQGVPTTGEQAATLTSGIKSLPQVALDGDGNAIVVWKSQLHSDSPDRDGINARQFTSAGQPDAAEAQINTTFEGEQFTPDVVVNTSGQGVMVWSSDEYDGDGSSGILAQRFTLALGSVAPPSDVPPSDVPLKQLVTDGAISPSLGLLAAVGLGLLFPAIRKRLWS